MLNKYRLLLSQANLSYLMRPQQTVDSGELSPREREIVRFIAQGNTNKEISSALSISVKTVETHRSRLMLKLDLHSIASLIRYALRQGLADL